MLIEDVKKLSPYERLVYWIEERENVRLKKEAGSPLPFTDDERLQQYKFTNVRRMDDRVSKALLSMWYKPFFNHSNMLVACSLARHFNRPEALEKITQLVFGKTYLPNNIKTVLRKLKAEGGKVFSGAYLIRGIEAKDKIEMVVTNVTQPLFDNPPKLNTDSIEQCVNALLPYWGFSHFIAGQVIADMVFAVKGRWLDRKTWAAIGPGSRRGMNRLLGRDKDSPMKQQEFTIQLSLLRAKLSKDLPSIMKRLDAIDEQNCLCEFDKSERLLFGEGRPKHRYQGV